MLKSGDFDWKAIFARGVRWFHSGGIFAALSATTGDLILEAMRAAKQAPARWSRSISISRKAVECLGRRANAALDVLRRIVENVDVLVGNEEDLQKGLGIAGPEVAAQSKLDPSQFLSLIGQVTQKHPNIKIVATTLREVHSANRHTWSAVAWVNGKSHVCSHM